MWLVALLISLALLNIRAITIHNPRIRHVFRINKFLSISEQNFLNVLFFQNLLMKKDLALEGDLAVHVFFLHFYS